MARLTARKRAEIERDLMLGRSKNPYRSALLLLSLLHVTDPYVQQRMACWAEEVALALQATHPADLPFADTSPARLLLALLAARGFSVPVIGPETLAHTLIELVLEQGVGLSERTLGDWLSKQQP